MLSARRPFRELARLAGLDLPLDRPGPAPRVRARLAMGAGETALFLPFLGEIGWLVMWFMRLVHFSEASRKIVCCRRGQECLFPAADEFFYDWVDPVDDATRSGSDRNRRDWPHILGRFPGAVPVASGNLQFDEELVPVRPGFRIPIRPYQVRGLKADVCIGTRNRKFCPDKNYPHWPQIARTLQSCGLTFAVIGSRESSIPLDGMACMSGDFGDFDAAIELLQNCRLFIGTDSGGAHLASAANGCPLVVQEVPEEIARIKGRCFIPRMAATTDHPVIHLPAATWHQPAELLSRALAMI
jgi:hypothetical protein